MFSLCAFLQGFPLPLFKGFLLGFCAHYFIISYAFFSYVFIIMHFLLCLLLHVCHYIFIFFFVHCVFTLTTWPQHLVGIGRSRLRFICVVLLQFFVFLFSFGWSFSTHFFSGPWSSSSPRGTNRLPCHLVFFLRLYISMSFQVLV